MAHKLNLRLRVEEDGLRKHLQTQTAARGLGSRVRLGIFPGCIIILGIIRDLYTIPDQAKLIPVLFDDRSQPPLAAEPINVSILISFLQKLGVFFGLGTVQPVEKFPAYSISPAAKARAARFFAVRANRLFTICSG